MLSSTSSLFEAGSSPVSAVASGVAGTGNVGTTYVGYFSMYICSTCMRDYFIYEVHISIVIKKVQLRILLNFHSTNGIAWVLLGK